MKDNTEANSSTVELGPLPNPLEWPDGQYTADDLLEERARCYALGVAAERERCTKLCESLKRSDPCKGEEEAENRAIAECVRRIRDGAPHDTPRVATFEGCTFSNTVQIDSEELAALRKDAERYRWLRDVASGGDWEHIGQTTDPANTDARIDECMAVNA